MTDLIIYGDPRSSYVRTARMTAEEKGVPYALKPVAPGTEEIKTLHPWGKMPSMRHGDLHLFETSGICHYLDAAFDGPSLVPADPVALGEMEQWISATIDYAYATMVQQYLFSYILPKTEDGQPDMAAIEAVRPEVRRQVLLYDGALDGRQFMCGDALSLADLFIVPIFFYLKQLPDADQVFAGCDNIAAFGERTAARASFAATMPAAPEETAAAE